MIAAAMSMRRQVSQNAAARALDQPLRSSVLGKSAAVALREAPETQRAPAESEGVASLQRAAPATESPHPTPSNSQGDSDCSCRALLALRPYVVGVSTRRSTRWSIGRVADLKVGPSVVNHFSVR